MTGNKILVIFGPNMNLIGLRKRDGKTRVTLDKLSRHLRKTATKIGLSLTILQTNNESRAVNQIQRQRKKIKGILIFPGPWQQSGHVLNDTLGILSIPCVTISNHKKEEALKVMKNIEEKDIYKSSEEALFELSETI